MKADIDKATEKITEQIIGSAFEVINELGHGFHEAVYQKALVHELRSRKLVVQEQVPFQILYKEMPVGKYVSDIIVGETVVVELKTVEKLAPVHIGQVLNYLRASHLSVGLLLNFGNPKLEYRRVLL